MAKIKTAVTILLIITLNLFVSGHLKAQEETYKPSVLNLKGYVYEEDEKVEEALILLYQNKTVVKKILTKKNAKFQFVLFKNSKYLIKILKDGFVEEHIIVATKDSPDYSNKKYLFEFSVDLKKTKQFEGLKLTAFEFPSAKINYSVEKNEYVYDRFYDKMIKTRIKKLKLMSDSKIEEQQ